jgi:hypothetical protein
VGSIFIELDSKPDKMGLPIADTNPQPGDYINAYGYGRGNKVTVLSGPFLKYLGNPRDPTSADWFAVTWRSRRRQFWWTINYFRWICNRKSMG